MIRNTLLLLFISFLISASYAQAPVNELCEDAIVIECGELVSGTTEGASSEFLSNTCFFLFDPRVWFQVTGDGSIHVFSFLNSSQGSFEFTIISNNCTTSSSMQCRGDHFFNSIDDTLRINTVPGEDLFIAVTVDCCNNSGSFEFMYECEEAPVNDLCSNAIELNCQDIVDLSLSAASSGHFDRLCRNEREPDLWYEIIGDDMIHVIESVNNIDNNFEIDVYEGDCLTRFDTCPIENLEFNFSDTLNTFFANASNTYLLRIYSRFDDVDSIRLNHFCMLPASNDLCVNAENIACGTPLIGNTAFATTSNEFNGCTFEGDKDVWFTLQGDDMVHILTADSIQNFRVDIEIYEEACSLNYTICRQQIFLSLGESSTFFAESGITYNIRVTARDGFFEISNDCMLPVENDSCNGAIDISCGQSITGDTELATSTMLFNGCTQESNPDLWYEIIGNDELISFTSNTINEIRTNLDIYEGQCSSNYTDCSLSFSLDDGETNFFLAEAGTTYLIRVSVFRFFFFDNFGAFDLDIECLEPEPNDSCENPNILNCNETFEGDFTFATPEFDSNPCDFNLNENDLWYEIVGDDMVHILTLDSSDFRRLRLEVIIGSCDINSNECFERIDIGEGIQYSFFAEQGSTYLIRAFKSCCNRDDNFFRVEYNCLPLAANDNCDSPELWECSSEINGTTFTATSSNEFNGCIFEQQRDLWYFISGDDMVHSIGVINDNNNIDLFIYNESCDSDFTNCQIEFNTFGGGSGYNFLAESGQTYLVRLTASGCCDGNEDFQLSHECHIPPPNNFCENATPISCGDIIDGQTSLATPSTFANNCFGGQDPNDLFYEIIGDGQLHFFNNVNQNAQNININILESPCNSSDGNCPNSIGSLSPGNGFLTENGVIYLIRIFSNIQGDDFQVEYTCEPLASNNTCTQAEEILCDNIISGNTSQATETNIISECGFLGNQDLWYTIEGDGMIHEFILLNGSLNAVRLLFLENECAFDFDFFNGNCFESSLFNSSSGFSVLLEENITYFIRIASGSFDNGDFMISHECRELAENDTCQNSNPISCGDLIEGDTRNATSEFPFIGCSSQFSPELWYSFEGDGSIFNFEFLESNSNCISIGIFENLCPQDGESCIEGGNFNSDGILRFFSEVGTNYFLRVTTCNTAGEFSINLNCTDPAPNDLCENAITPICGQAIQGNTNLATFSNEFNGCVNENGNDVWYIIEGDGRVHSFFEASNTFFDIELDLFEGNCNSGFTNCTTDINIRFGNSFAFLAEMGTTYYLRISTNRFDDSRPFVIGYDCDNPPLNDNCENAIEIGCNIGEIQGSSQFATSQEQSELCDNQNYQDVWYSITGDDQLHAFLHLDGDGVLIEIYEGSCDILSCQNSTFFLGLGSEPVRFIADEGQAYLIRIFNTNFNSLGEFSFIHMCMDPVENDRCQDAIEINCGEPIIGDFSFSTSENVFNGCQEENENDIWYSIEGDDQKHIFTLLESEGNRLFIDIFENNCDIPRATCNNSLSIFEGRSSEFVFAEGITYLLRIYQSTFSNSSVSFEFNHDCFIVPDNDLCINALPISCGDIIEGNTLAASVDNDTNSCRNRPNPGLWYSIVGDGHVHTFNLIDSETSNILISVFEDDCDSTICLFSDFANEFLPRSSFLTTLNENYLINISVDFGPDGAFTLEHTCGSAAINDACENATPLNCGESLEGNFQNSTSSDIQSNCIFEITNDVWYTINGDGNAHTFTKVDPLDSDVFIEIFAAQCDARFDTCPMDLISNPDEENSLFFIAEDGVSYLIRVASSFTLDFNYSHTCVGPKEVEGMTNSALPNDECSGAIEFTCGEILQIDVSEATADLDHNNCGFTSGSDLPGLWYRFKGDGNILVLNTNQTDLPPLVFVYINDCSSTICTEPMYDFNVDRTIFIPTVLDSNYYVLVRSIIPSINSEVIIEVDCIELSTNDFCEDATEITCGQEFPILINSASHSDGFNGCTVERDNDVWYKFIGTGQILKFSIETESLGQFFAEIEFYEGSCLNFQNCSTLFELSSFNGSSGEFITQQEVEYMIRFSSGFFNPSLASLRFDCFNRSENDLCENAIEINCDSLINGNLLAATSNGGFNGCQVENDNDLWYSLLGDGQVHSFTPNIVNPELVLEFYEAPCTTQHLVCNQAIAVPQFGQAGNFLTEDGITYLIRLYKPFPSNNDEFSLSHTCGEVLLNDECEQALVINCQNTIEQNILLSTVSQHDSRDCQSLTGDVWYVLEGDSTFHEFNHVFFNLSELNFTIFEGSCPSNFTDECSLQFTLNEENDNFVFFAEEETNYYISVSTDDSQGNIAFSNNCIAPPANDQCLGATPLICGNMISSNTQLATSQPVFMGCDFNTENDLWYSIIGDDRFHVFDDINRSSETIRIDVFSGTCENYFQNCITDFRLNFLQFSNSFFAENGVEYLIRISIDCCDDTSFLIDYSCADTVINDTCDEAIILDCDETFDISLQNATYSPIFSDCHNTVTGDVWYQINGDDQVKTLTIDSLIDLNIEIDIYTQECTNKYTCIDQLAFEGNAISQAFFANEGTTYFLRFFTNGTNFLPRFNLQLSCNQQLFNTVCEAAIPLNCGEELFASTFTLPPTEGISGCYFGYENSPVIWYSIQGDNQVQHLNIESQDVRPYLSIYTNTCNQLSCANSMNTLFGNNFATTSFVAERDSTYYILISAMENFIPVSGDETGQFEISLSCEAIPENNFSEQAQQTSCGETIQGSIINANPNELQLCEDEPSELPGVWYKYQSNGDSLELAFTELGFVPTVSLYEVIVDSLACVEEKAASILSNSLNTCEVSSLPSITMPCFESDMESICVPIMLENTEDLVSLNFNIQFDTTFIYTGANFNNIGVLIVGNGMELNELNIDWERSLDGQIFLDESTPYFFELCFDRKTQGSFAELELTFIGESEVIESPQNGRTSEVGGCFDSGIAFRSESNIQCDEEIKLNFTTNPDTEYFIFVGGSNTFDSGDFTFTMNCELAPEPITDIPTLSEWGLICLSLLLMIFSIVAMKQESMSTVPRG